jgi:hypothetical protein
MAMLRTANGIDRSRPYSENVGNCFAKLQRRAEIAKGIMAIFKSSVLKLLPMVTMVMGLRRGLKAPSASGFRCLSARPRPARTHFSPSWPSHFITQQANVSRLAFRQHPSPHRAPVGLAYIPGGCRCHHQPYTTSALIDRNYKFKAGRIGFTVGDDLVEFSIEEVRFRWAGILNTLFLCAMVGYGCSLIDTYMSLSL